MESNNNNVCSIRTIIYQGPNQQFRQIVYDYNILKIKFNSSNIRDDLKKTFINQLDLRISAVIQYSQNSLPDWHNQNVNQIKNEIYDITKLYDYHDISISDLIDNYSRQYSLYANIQADLQLVYTGITNLLKRLWSMTTQLGKYARDSCNIS